jgi:tRNA threonylcarbamoyladenosine biosynthesis protein TsaE
VETVGTLTPEDSQQWESDSEEETFRLGEALGRVLQPGDVVGLVGALGAGKTHLVRGVAHGAQVPAGEVASPTFAITYTYGGRIRLHHVDLYRVENVDELYATGYFELPEPDAALLVEWLDKLAEAYPGHGLVIRLEAHPQDSSRRLITVQSSGSRASRLLEDWLRESRGSASRLKP